MMARLSPITLVLSRSMSLAGRLRDRQILGIGFVLTKSSALIGD
jgi:hypothetical protein